LKRGPYFVNCFSGNSLIISLFNAGEQNNEFFESLLLFLALLCCGDLLFYRFILYEVGV